MHVIDALARLTWGHARSNQLSSPQPYHYLLAGETSNSCHNEWSGNKNSGLAEAMFCLLDLH